MTTTLPEVDETTLVYDEPDVPCDVMTNWASIACGRPAVWDVILTCERGRERVRHRCAACHDRILRNGVCCSCDGVVPGTHEAITVAAYPRRTS